MCVLKKETFVFDLSHTHTVTVLIVTQDVLPSVGLSWLLNLVTCCFYDQQAGTSHVSIFQLSCSLLCKICAQNEHMSLIRIILEVEFWKMDMDSDKIYASMYTNHEVLEMM